MLWIFILVFAVGAFVKFCASDTGMKFFNRLNEKTLERDLKKIDKQYNSSSVANFHLKLDEDGKIIAVELEGYGEVSLDFIKETEPRAYKQIMDAYENFKRESGFRD